MSLNFNAEKVSKVIFAAAISAFCPNEKLTFSAENAMIQKKEGPEHMINLEIISHLSPITEEEQAILNGQTSIDREIYMAHRENSEINAKKLLADGKLITWRPHTRFINFPDHTHDYVEVIYACSGKTTHIVDGNYITLDSGELLLLGQHAHHSVMKASLNDITVNFIVLPEFFNTALNTISGESTPLRHFLLDCLFGQNNGPNYLYFQVGNDQPIQNLVENLLFILLDEKRPNRRTLSQLTMALLFLNLMNYTEKLASSKQEALVLSVLRYLDECYADSNLDRLAKQLNVDPSTISKEVHKKTGRTYIALLQEKRLSQAVYLLLNTDKKVADIAESVGYKNASYFHRIFLETYGVSPRIYRLQKQNT